MQEIYRVNNVYEMAGLVPGSAFLAREFPMGGVDVFYNKIFSFRDVRSEGRFLTQRVSVEFLQFSPISEVSGYSRINSSKYDLFKLDFTNGIVICTQNDLIDWNSYIEGSQGYEKRVSLVEGLRRDC